MGDETTRPPPNSGVPGGPPNIGDAKAELEVVGRLMLEHDLKYTDIIYTPIAL